MTKYRFLYIIIPVVCTVLALTGFGWPWRIGVSLSCAAVLCAVYGAAVKSRVWIIIVALLVSIAGDWVLAHRDTIPNGFIWGIALYFTAHAAYLWFALKSGRTNRIVLFAVLAACIAFYITLLMPAISSPALNIAVLAYLIISCLSLGAAAGIRVLSSARWLFIAGIASIIFSDTLIALREFAGIAGWSRLIMPTYYLSHLLITLSLIIHNNV